MVALVLVAVAVVALLGGLAVVVVFAVLRVMAACISIVLLFI